MIRQDRYFLTFFALGAVLSSLVYCDVAFEEKSFEVPKYPCHTQAVERAVRIVSEASAAVIGADAREGFIQQRVEAREELPKFESKKDYLPKIKCQQSTD